MIKTLQGHSHIPFSSSVMPRVQVGEFIFSYCKHVTHLSLFSCSSLPCYLIMCKRSTFIDCMQMSLITIFIYTIIFSFTQTYYVIPYYLCDQRSSPTPPHACAHTRRHHFNTHTFLLLLAVNM